MSYDYILPYNIIIDEKWAILIMQVYDTRQDTADLRIAFRAVWPTALVAGRNER